LKENRKKFNSKKKGEKGEIEREKITVEERIFLAVIEIVFGSGLQSLHVHSRGRFSKTFEMIV